MDIETLKKEMPKTVSVIDAAEILGTTQMIVRQGLKQGLFPFGIAVQLNQLESYINTRRFIAYIEAQDLVRG